MSETSQKGTGSTDTPGVTVESVIEHAKRAFALRHYDEAAEHYATALELQTEKLGDDAPELADLYFEYGKALLENAIAQSSVVGKQQTENAIRNDEEDAGASSSSAFISFSGDAEEEDVPVDMFGEAEKAVAEADAGANDDDDDDDGEGEGDDGDGEEPEDDFNAAWEVLDLARAIYDRQKDADDEIKLKLADTYIALGDVSLETEKFDTAINDYETGLILKTELLPPSSRQLTEVHYKLSLALDITPGRLKDALEHAQKAVASTEARIAELRVGLQRGDVPAPPPEGANTDVKGKGKWTNQRLIKDSVEGMSKNQIEAEIKELTELRDDLSLKVEELGQPADGDAVESAPAMAAKALDKELNAGSSAVVVPQSQVNDLTAVVKKKKKVEPPANGTNGTGKRKADDEAASPPDKKAKLGETS